MSIAGRSRRAFNSLCRMAGKRDTSKPALRAMVTRLPFPSFVDDARATIRWGDDRVGRAPEPSSNSSRRLGSLIGSHNSAGLFPWNSSYRRQASNSETKPAQRSFRQPRISSVIASYPKGIGEVTHQLCSVKLSELLTIDVGSVRKLTLRRSLRVPRPPSADPEG